MTTNSDKRSTRTARNGATVKREKNEKLKVAMENEKLTLDGNKQQKVAIL